MGIFGQCGVFVFVVSCRKGKVLLMCSDYPVRRFCCYKNNLRVADCTRICDLLHSSSRPEFRGSRKGYYWLLCEQCEMARATGLKIETNP